MNCFLSYLLLNSFFYSITLVTGLLSLKNEQDKCGGFIYQDKKLKEMVASARDIESLVKSIAHITTNMVGVIQTHAFSEEDDRLTNLPIGRWQQ